MTTLTPSPKMQFFDANGNPLVGGKLYTYAAGTTTPLATYTDSTGGTPNTNPVILNARGEASVWLGSSPYYMELKDSTDALIWTADNISSFSSFIQSGSGAVSRTVQSKLRDFISVLDFGADSSGITSSVTAFQNAINSTVNSGIQVIHVPRGTYLGDMTTLSVGSRNIVWEEEGGVTYTTNAPIKNRVNSTYLGDTTRPWQVGIFAIGHSPTGVSGTDLPMLRVQRDSSYTGGTALNPCALSVKTNVTTNNGTKENAILSELDDSGTAVGKSRTAIMAECRRKVDNTNNIISGNIVAKDETTHKSSTNNGALVALELDVSASGPDDATGGRRFGLDVVLLEQATSLDGATTAQAGIRVRNAGSAFSATNTWNYGVLVQPDSTNGGVSNLFAGFGSPTSVLFTRTDNTALIDLGSTLSAGYVSNLQYTGQDSGGSAIPYAQIKTAVVSNTAGAATGRIDFTPRESGTLVVEMSIANGVKIGAPTGSFKGTGTLNVAGDIYKNNSAYTNPDYVFEKAYTGQIVKFANNPGASTYTGPKTINEIEKITRDTLRLPGFHSESTGAFERFDMLLEKLEEAYLCIFELNSRLEKLESK